MTMSIEEKAEMVVRQCVEAFNRGALNGLKSLFAEEAEIQAVFGKGIFEKIEPIWRQPIEGYGMQLKIPGIGGRRHRRRLVNSSPLL